MRVLTSGMIAICVILLGASAASAVPSNAALIAQALGPSSLEFDVRCDWRSVRVCRNHSCRRYRRPVCD
jgi:hypothetical protein